MSDIKQNLAEVLEKIKVAAENAGRSASDVELVAVSKVHGEDRILPALEAGQRIFGENRVQEAMAKWPDLKKRFPDVSLHLIGPLQTNKVKDAIAIFDVIETVDREKLARKLADVMNEQDTSRPVYIQVNTGAEPQKAGVLPEEADDFIAFASEELGLHVIGLMAIPPVDEEPSLHFSLLEKIAHRNELYKLSMGMSGDFEVAVQFGATSVRVGSAIFGARN